MRLTYLHIVIPVTSRKLYFYRTDSTLDYRPKESEEEKTAVTIHRYNPTFPVEGQNKRNNFVIKIGYEWFTKCGSRNHKVLVTFLSSCYYTRIKNKSY